MNEKYLDAVERRAALSVELQNQLQDGIRAMADQALELEGITDDSIKQAGSLANQFEATERKRQALEKLRRNNEIAGNALLVTTSLSMLPHSLGSIKGEYFSLADRSTATSLLDTVVWVGRKQQPYYILGYRYSDNTALVVDPIPENRDRIFSGRMIYTDPLSFEKDTLRPVVTRTVGTYIYTPQHRSDKKIFQKFFRQDVHVHTAEVLSGLYVPAAGAYVVSKDSNGVMAARDKSGMFDGDKDDTEFGLQKVVPTTELLEAYGVLDQGMVRLMTSFGRGQEYLWLLNDIANGYLLETVRSAGLVKAPEAKGFPVPDNDQWKHIGMAAVNVKYI